MKYLKNTLHQQLIDFRYYLLTFLFTLFVELMNEIGMFDEDF